MWITVTYWILLSSVFRESFGNDLNKNILPHSKDILIRTLDSNLTFTNVTSDQFIADWKEVPKTESYEISWKGKVKWLKDKHTTGSDKTKHPPYILTYLIPFTNYEFSITPVSKKLRQAPIVGNITTKESPPSAPQNLNVNQNGTCVRITWSEPLNENGKIKYYNVSWRLSSENESWHYTNTTNLSYLIENLQGCSTYDVEVKALNGAGYGKSASTRAITSKDGPPVEDLNVAINSSTSATLSWNPPPTNCTLDNYILNYDGFCLWNSSKNVSKFDIEIRNNETEYILENLIPMTAYNFCLSASLVNESGFNTEICIDIETFEGVPGPPQSLKIVEDSITKDSLAINWENPIELNGIVNYFRIKYKGNGESKDIVKYHSNNETYPYHIEGLKSNTLYEITVQGITNTGYGVPARITARTNVNSLAIALGVTIPLIIIGILVGIAYLKGGLLNCCPESVKKAFVN